MREVYYWFGFCLLCCFAVLFVLFNPGIGEYSPLWVEVAGTTLGIALVLSFERTTRLAVDIRKGNALKLALSQELLVGTLDFGKAGLVKVSIDLWEMAKSTGDLALITSEERWRFLMTYKVIGHYNELVEKHNLTLMVPEASEEQLARLRAKVDGIADALSDVIPETLEAVMGSKFLQRLEELSKEQVETEDADK